MQKKLQPNASRVVLVKWRFKPREDGEHGTAKMWWSDGSKSEIEATYLDAVRGLSAVQDSGGEKPA
ncbi:MAG TPA: hypothetical protein VL752_21420 [Acidisoma sp.]|uniref:hypothetical protein n=1 Tax=Acidisoma sp. TaxID=1872115 RepID=UPI002B76FADA|nr:hypothetical protein [Acidisoma sp.]HTI03513.1 hypothetical protein [Acidisoma sp.]